jgi:hypothetical protein
MLMTRQTPPNSNFSVVKITPSPKKNALGAKREAYLKLKRRRKHFLVSFCHSITHTLAS